MTVYDNLGGRLHVASRVKNCDATTMKVFSQGGKLGLVNLPVIFGAVPKLESGHERPDDEGLILR